MPSPCGYQRRLIPMPKRPIPRLDELQGTANAVLSNIANPELMTLKALAVAEAALVHLLAARLSCDDKALPWLTFPALTKLAFAGLHPGFTKDLERALTVLNEMRTEAAHEFGPWDQEARMRELDQFGYRSKPVPWPSDAATQEVRYRSALAGLLGYLAGMADLARSTEGERVLLEAPRSQEPE